jgi:hypothetical protein
MVELIWYLFIHELFIYIVWKANGWINIAPNGCHIRICLFCIHMVHLFLSLLPLSKGVFQRYKYYSLQSFFWGICSSGCCWIKKLAKIVVASRASWALAYSYEASSQLPHHFHRKSGLMCTIRTILYISSSSRFFALPFDHNLTWKTVRVTQW